MQQVPRKKKIRERPGPHAALHAPACWLHRRRTHLRLFRGHRACHLHNTHLRAGARVCNRCGQATPARPPAVGDVIMETLGARRPTEPARISPVPTLRPTQSRSVGRAWLWAAFSTRSWKKDGRSSYYRRYLLAGEQQRWQNASRFGKSAASRTCCGGPRNTSCSAAGHARKRNAAAWTSSRSGRPRSSDRRSWRLSQGYYQAIHRGEFPPPPLGVQAYSDPQLEHITGLLNVHLDVCTPTKSMLPCPPSSAGFSARSLQPAARWLSRTRLFWQRKKNGKAPWWQTASWNCWWRLTWTSSTFLATPKCQPSPAHTLPGGLDSDSVNSLPTRATFATNRAEQGDVLGRAHWSWATRETPTCVASSLLPSRPRASATCGSSMTGRSSYGPGPLTGRPRIFRGHRRLRGAWQHQELCPRPLPA